MNRAVKLILVMLISAPFTYSVTDTREAGNDPEGRVTDTEIAPSLADSPDSPTGQEEPTSSDPTSLPSLSVRLATNSSSDLASRVLQGSKLRFLLGMGAESQPNKFSCTARPLQRSLLRLARIPSSDMALLATLDQAQAPPLS